MREIKKTTTVNQRDDQGIRCKMVCNQSLRFEIKILIRIKLFQLEKTLQNFRLA